MSHPLMRFKFPQLPTSSIPFLAYVTSRAHRSMHVPHLIIPRRPLSTVMPADPLEEELLPHYNEAHFYPVRPDEVFKKRYKAITKLGFGGGSTVWLARDLNLCVST